MSARKIIIFLSIAAILSCNWGYANTQTTSLTPLSAQSLPELLGWIPSSAYLCGGYYQPDPIVPVEGENNHAFHINGDETTFAEHGTSTLTGHVSITRDNKRITAHQVTLYRSPETNRYSTMDITGNVHMQEPKTLAIATKAHYNFISRAETLYDAIYRTQLAQAGSANTEQIVKGKTIRPLTAWGGASEFTQSHPKIYELTDASFSTCPPDHPAWQVRSSHLVINKNTGRGYATHAKIFVKSVPIFYAPYISFSIDHQRKSGFLWPTFGTRWGPYLTLPFYWNLAPNYDTTITTGILTKRGIQLTDDFRYLTHLGDGHINLSVLPNDRLFQDFQKNAPAHVLVGDYGSPTDPAVQAELNRLEGDNLTRKALFWRDDTRYNEHWSSHLDFNYAGDDYYLRDFGSNLNEITQNQLLQEGDLYYKGTYWNFTGRLQAYQTLHPLDSPPVQNQYRRFPQLLLSGDFPDQPMGLEFFIGNEATHFEMLKTPGTHIDPPIGNRLHTQPGVSFPIYKPSFYVNPRLQVALTNYNMYQNTDTGTPGSIHRAIPIFDFASGLYFTREQQFFSYHFNQTLEPQVYYTYIPYRNQSSIPVFDTTVNTLTYDQLFTYNRFSGIDRIGDANQIGMGVTTRFIDDETGLEKIRLSAGEIAYFANRLVTLCNDNSCSDNPDNHSNYQRLSPLSGLLSYNVNPAWNVTSNAIWDPVSKQVDNSTVNFHYKPDNNHIVNMGFSYARNGNTGSGIILNTDENNLKLTDVSFSWPISYDINMLGRWSQDWSQQHFQNLIYGLQYDTCCWAVRLVGSRTFTNLSQDNNTPLYDTIYYLEFNLKGLGNIGTGNPNGLLSSITGYNTSFGQEI